MFEEEIIIRNVTGSGDIDLLVDNGADINTVDKRNYSSLMIAIDKGNLFVK